MKLKKRVALLQDQAQKLQTGDEAMAESVTQDDDVVIKGKLQENTAPKSAKPTRGSVPEDIAAAEIEAKPLATYVFNRKKVAALADWVKKNWFYVVAALSLALAGVFLVHYGSESGWLFYYYFACIFLSLPCWRRLRRRPCRFCNSGRSTAVKWWRFR